MSSSNRVLSNFVLVPLIWFIGSHLDSAIYPATGPMPRMAFSFDAIGFILGLGYVMGLKCVHA